MLDCTVFGFSVGIVEVYNGFVFFRFKNFMNWKNEVMSRVWMESRFDGV